MSDVSTSSVELCPSSEPENAVAPLVGHSSGETPFAAAGPTELTSENRSHAPQSLPPGLAPLPTPGALFGALRQAWFLGLGAALLGAVLTAFLLLRLMPHTYVATVWLHLDAPLSAPATDEIGESARPTTTPPPQLFKSPPLMTRVLDLPQVSELVEVRRHGQSRSWLEENLQVETVDPVLVRLTLTTHERQTGVVMLEKIVEVYQEQLREHRQTVLAQLRDQLQRLAGASGHPTAVLSMSAKPPLATQARKDPPPSPAVTALAETRLELRRLEAELASQPDAQAGSFGKVSSARVEALLAQDDTVKTARAECTRLEDLLVKIKETAAQGERSPYYQEKAQLLEAVRLSIGQRRQQIVDKLEQQQREKMNQEQQTVVRKLRQQVDALQERERALIDEINKANPEQSNDLLSQGGHRPLAPVDSARRAASTTEASSQAGKQEALRRLGAEIQLLELAGPDVLGVEQIGDLESTASQGGKRARTIGLSAATVFVVLLLAVAWLEFQDRRVRTAESVSQGLQMPVIGMVPAGPLPAVLPTGPTTGLQELAHQNRLSEATDVVRALVLRRLAGRPGVILVAGARGNEGATSVACQLALSLARGWRRTLLIDGHFRQPALHTRFQAGLEPGLSEVLRGEIDAPDAVQPTKASRLWLLPTGNWDNHALQALAQETSTALFESLKDQYDVIVIDGGPVMPLADALLLGQQADFVVLSALCGTSRLPALHEARERLTNLGVPTLGVVVNGVAPM